MLYIILYVVHCFILEGFGLNFYIQTTICDFTFGFDIFNFSFEMVPILDLFLLIIDSFDF